MSRTIASTDKLSFSGNFLIHLNMLFFLFKYLYIVYLCELDNKLIYKDKSNNSGYGGSPE